MKSLHIVLNSEGQHIGNQTANNPQRAVYLYGKKHGLTGLTAVDFMDWNRKPASPAPIPFEIAAADPSHPKHKSWKKLMGARARFAKRHNDQLAELASDDQTASVILSIAANITNPL
jgi:hypothetical protein